MSKILSEIFPLLDYLYLLQVMEYDSNAFLGWFVKNPTKRNLQKKHKLVWTNKVQIIFLLSLIILITICVYGAFWLNNFIFIPVLFILLFQLSPIFLVVSLLLLYPLESYQKSKILRSAEAKISKLTNLKVIAITGSFGKTSTKDILYTLLWKKYRVVKTPKSFNTPLGISQTVLEDLKPNTDVFIAEVGAYKIGEIAKIAKLIKPKIAIITAVAPQHLEKFGSIENIATAKFELAESLNNQGISILNKSFDLIVKKAQNLNNEVIFYGTDDSPFKASDIKVSIEGTAFLMHTPKGNIQIQLPLIGEHHALNFLAASAAALEVGLSLQEIQKRALLLLPTPHRMEINTNQKYTLIDNSFNSNLESAKSSFKLLADLKSTQKIIITPGLIELGKDAEKTNKQFISEATKVADVLIIVGENNKKYLSEGIKESHFDLNQVYFVSNTLEGVAIAGQMIKKDGVILIENDLPDQYL